MDATEIAKQKKGSRILLDSRESVGADRRNGECAVALVCLRKSEQRRCADNSDRRRTLQSPLSLLSCSFAT